MQFLEHWHTLSESWSDNQWIVLLTISILSATHAEHFIQICSYFTELWKKEKGCFFIWTLCSYALYRVGQKDRAIFEQW